MSDDLKLADYDHPMSLVTWQSWVDDLPLPPEFGPAQDAMQEYLYAQAAELTRLRAKVEAADKLAELVRQGKVIIDPCWPMQSYTWQRDADAALSAYEEAGK